MWFSHRRQEEPPDTFHNRHGFPMPNHSLSTALPRPPATGFPPLRFSRRDSREKQHEKPAELTSCGIFEATKLCSEAGLPDGVLNVVPGEGSVADQVLTRHPGMRKIPVKTRKNHQRRACGTGHGKKGRSFRAHRPQIPQHKEVRGNRGTHNPAELSPCLLSFRKTAPSLAAVCTVRIPS